MSLSHIKCQSFHALYVYAFVIYSQKGAAIALFFHFHRWAVEDAQRVIQELKEEIMLEKNTISSLDEQLQKTQQYNMKLVSEVDELLDAAKNNDATRASEDSLAQVESVWTKKLAAKDDEIKDLQAKIMHLEEKSSQMQTSASPPAGDPGDALVNGLQNMVKQLQQDVEELESDTIRLTEENNELHAKLESSISELNEKSKLIADLNASGSTSQPRAPDNLLKQLQQDVEELEADTIRLTEENSELKAKLESSNLELSEKNKLIADLKASGSASQPRAPDNLLRQLQQDVEELEADTIRLTEENSELRAKLESSSSEISEKSISIADLKASESAGEGRAQLLAKVVNLEGELSRLKEGTAQISAEKEEVEKSIQRLQAENQELQKSIERLEGSHPENFGRGKDRELANNKLFQQLAETVTGLEEELQESQEESRLSRYMELHIPCIISSYFVVKVYYNVPILYQNCGIISILKF
jgi:chromosome segregation ATPase